MQDIIQKQRMFKSTQTWSSATLDLINIIVVINSTFYDLYLISYIANINRYAVPNNLREY